MAKPTAHKTLNTDGVLKLDIISGDYKEPGFISIGPKDFPGADVVHALDKFPWPFAPQFGVHEVVGVVGEVRGSYDGESRDHFRNGLDIQANMGTPVLAVVGGHELDVAAIERAAGPEMQIARVRIESETQITRERMAEYESWRRAAGASAPWQGPGDDPEPPAAGHGVERVVQQFAQRRLHSCLACCWAAPASAGEPRSQVDRCRSGRGSSPPCRDSQTLGPARRSCSRTARRPWPAGRSAGSSPRPVRWPCPRAACAPAARRHRRSAAARTPRP